MVTIDKGKAMTSFAKDLIQLETLNVTLEGSTDTTAYCAALGYDMHITGIPVVLPDPDIKPRPLGPVTVSGMGGLKDIEILSYSIPGNVPNDGSYDGCNEKCGIVMNIEARVNNPSPFGLKIGTLNSYIQDSTKTTLGDVTATDLTLLPGDNVIAMAGRMHPADDAVDAAAAFMSTYMQNNAQETSVLGKDAGPSTIPWLNDVVDGITMSATFPGAGDDFAALTKIVLNTMDMELTSDGGVRAAAKVTAKLNVPSEISQDIIEDVTFSGMEFELIDIDNNSTHVGHIKVDVSAVPVVYNADKGTIVAEFEKVDMDILNSDGLALMIKDLMTSVSKNVRMEGTAAPTVTTNMGVLQLTDIPFGGETIMYGFNNLMSDDDEPQPLLKIDSIDVMSGTTDTLTMSVNCSITNPSQVKTELGSMTMDLFTETDPNDSESPYKIGQVVIEDFNMDANEERNAVTSFYNTKATYKLEKDTDAAKAASKKFLSQFVSGHDQVAAARGPADGSGTDLDLLKPAILALSTSATVPGLPDLVLTQSTMYNEILHVATGKLRTTLYVTNPFSATMTVTGTSCEIYPCKTLDNSGKPLSEMSCSEYYDSDHSAGLYTENFGDPVVVPGKSGLFTLPDKDVSLHKMIQDAGELITTLTRAGDTGDFINLSGTLDAVIGDFVQQIDFHQKDVPICEGDRHCFL